MNTREMNKGNLPLIEEEYGVPVADRDDGHLLLVGADDDGLGESSTSAVLTFGSVSAYWRYSMELSDSEGVT